jgi:stearoyl-CoA desaturase (delta-9 desaturase)
MRTREWVAVHRKHHAKCETAEDPHSPQVLGINRVMWGGVFLYVKASADQAMVARYGAGTPDDWIERNLYSRYVLLGLTFTGMADVLLFGIVPGVLIFLTQIAWIPFWAAGVINGVGHFSGYRNWESVDASTNMSPWGILIGGEELHNNHHAYPTSAKFSNKWYEFDIGWLYVRILQALGLAKVKHGVPVPQFVTRRREADLTMLQAVTRHRYRVLAAYAESMRQVGPRERKALATMAEMRSELMSLWARSMAPSDELVTRLQTWCKRADTSEIRPLVEFSRALRSYA